MYDANATLYQDPNATLMGTSAGGSYQGGGDPNATLMGTYQDPNATLMGVYQDPNATLMGTGDPNATLMGGAEDPNATLMGGGPVLVNNSAYVISYSLFA